MYAQDANWWGTTVDLSDSKADLEKFLRKKGSKEFAAWEKLAADGTIQMIVQFEWKGEILRFNYQPLPLKFQPRSDKAKLLEKSHNQMGRKAFQHVKVVLNMAEEGHEEILMPYMPALTSGGQTLQQLGKSGWQQFLQDANDGRLALGPGTADQNPINATFSEVD